MISPNFFPRAGATSLANTTVSIPAGVFSSSGPHGSASTSISLICFFALLRATAFETSFIAVTRAYSLASLYEQAIHKLKGFCADARARSTTLGIIESQSCGSLAFGISESKACSAAWMAPAMFSRLDSRICNALRGTSSHMPLLKIYALDNDFEIFRIASVSMGSIHHSVCRHFLDQVLVTLVQVYASFVNRKECTRGLEFFKHDVSSMRDVNNCKVIFLGVADGHESRRPRKEAVGRVEEAKLVLSHSVLCNIGQKFAEVYLILFGLDGHLIGRTLDMSLENKHIL
ncbi:P-loop containing nucleoside triphosphate hydrolase protein, partial [Aureobasidium melanogenum]